MRTLQQPFKAAAGRFSPDLCQKSWGFARARHARFRILSGPSLALAPCPESESVPKSCLRSLAHSLSVTLAGVAGFQVLLGQTVPPQSFAAALSQD